MMTEGWKETLDQSVIMNPSRSAEFASNQLNKRVFSKKL
jgi:hypothetical protein